MPSFDDMIMVCNLYRTMSQKDHTIGLWYTDGEWVCDTLEDEYRANKVHGETRIPDGDYEIVLRTEGGFHERYKAKYGSWHQGMLHIINVPDFEWILVHILNHDDETDGCIGVGYNRQRGDNFIENSENAYIKMYPPIRNHLLRGGRVTLKIKTLDNYKN